MGPKSKSVRGVYVQVHVHVYLGVAWGGVGATRRGRSVGEWASAGGEGVSHTATCIVSLWCRADAPAAVGHRQGPQDLQGPRIHPRPPVPPLPLGIDKLI